MERLTKRHKDGYAIMDCPSCEMNKVDKCTAYACRERLKDRLAAYEDTGLEPDMIEATINGQITLQKALEKYTQAEDEGCLVVLPPPVKDGDPKPKCFYTDNQSIWCLGLAPADGDEPVERCKQCWYCEAGYAREEAERALEGGADHA